MLQVPKIRLTYENKNKNRVKVISSEGAYGIFKEKFNTSTIELKEEFHVMYLNRMNQVLGVYHLSTGSSNGTCVDLKHIFAGAVLSNSTGIILAHNHPSGNTDPSRQDMELTKRIKDAGKLLDITLLDHLIITKDDYYSFSDNDLM